MHLHPKITRECVLLDNECKQLLRRRSRQQIVREVNEKLNENNISQESELVNPIPRDTTIYKIKLDSPDKQDKQDKQYKEKISLYKLLLIVITCNNNDILD